MTTLCTDRSAAPRQSGPERRRQERVASTLRAAAYFPLFSVPNPATATVPLVLPGTGGLLVGMEVHESLHRFAMQTSLTANEASIAAHNRIGSAVAAIRIDWRVIPDDFVAAPGVFPPPTPLDPSRSQRFAMYDGHFDWCDSDQSGFRGFGTGRTFPSEDDPFGTVRIGAVVDILQGYGRLKSLQGNVVVNGVIAPPNDLALSVMVRMVDPTRRVPRMSVATPLKEIPSPDPRATFLTFIGEHYPQRPIILQTAPDGHLVGAEVHELLRLVRADCDVQGGAGLAARIEPGEVVGTLRFNLKFESRDASKPTPFSTEDAVFTFFSPSGDVIGSLEADVAEGLGFATRLNGAPQPVVRVVGFGPFQEGTGIFAETSGMLSLNGCISIPARTPSILYVLRVNDSPGFLQRWLR
jgi:hypothetical protein